MVRVSPFLRNEMGQTQKNAPARAKACKSIFGRHLQSLNVSNYQ